MAAVPSTAVLWRHGVRQGRCAGQTGLYARRLLHANHSLGYASPASSSAAASTTKQKERLVILGSGWGAMSLLKALDKKRYDVTVVSPNTYFAMTPLLAQAAVGTLELHAAMEPVRSNPDTQFFHAWTEAIDLHARRLTLMPAYPPAFREADPLHANDLAKANMQERYYPNARGGHSTMMVGAREEDGSTESINESVRRSHSHSSPSGERGREYTLDFDRLVIAVGAYNQTFNTPGVRENAWFLKDGKDASAIRWRVLEVFEQADHPDLSDEQRRRLLTFLIVGGGPTGSEFAAELHDLLTTDLKRLYPKLANLTSIKLIDASDGILNSFDAGLATYAREKFQRDGISLLLSRKISAVERGRLLVEPDGEIPFGLLVWSTGICAAPLVEETTVIAKDERGKNFLTDNQLRVLRAPTQDGEELTPVPNVYALGDCAQMQGKPLPATAQVASQKGKHLASVLNHTGDLDDHDTFEERIFRHKDMGSMASLGGGSAIVDSPKAKAHGRLAWVIWRSAYTLMSMSWRNRLLVPGFWMVNRIFGRDLTRF